MDLETLIQSEVSQKEKNKYGIIWLYVDQKNGTDELICKAETETQTWKTNLWKPRGEGKWGWIRRLDIYTLCACLLSCFSCVWLFVTLWTIAHHSPLSLKLSRQEYWSDCQALLQEIFPTQGLNLHLLCLLHWQVGSLPLVSPRSLFAYIQFKTIV